MTRRSFALLALLAGVAARAQEPVPLAVGQAVWRPSATVIQQPLPDGGQRGVQVDLYELGLAAPATLVFRLRAEGRLGMVVYAADRPAGGGGGPTLGAAGPSQPLKLELAAGRYTIAVAGDPPSDGAYLLSVAPAPSPEGFAARRELAATTDSLPTRGQWQIEPQPRSLALSPDGRWLAACTATEAWLYELPGGARYRLAGAGGELVRVQFARNGWALLVAGEAGTRLYSVPELAVIDEERYESGLRDAVLTGDGLRLAVLPRGGLVSIRSPVPGDLASLPESEGLALAGDGRGDRLAVRREDGTVALFDLVRRALIDRVRWPAAPTQMAVDPLRPVVLSAGPGASRAWLAQTGQPPQALPELLAVALGPNGEMALSDGTGVVFRYAADEANCKPAPAATLLAVDARGRYLAAATAEGLVTVWDTLDLAPERVLASPESERAAAAYEQGLTAMREGRHEAATRHFTAALTILADVPPDEPRLLEQTCLAILRLSECMWLLKQFEPSLEQARRLEGLAGNVGDAEARSALVAMARYRQGDALWELGRREEAKAVLRAALEAGLTGQSADDARAKLAQ